MTNDPNFRRYDRRLTRLLRAGRVEEAVRAYLHHPDRRFSLAYNCLTEGVDGYGIDRVYLNALRVLGRLIRDGEVKDAGHLHRSAVAVLRTLGRHHQYLAWHRDRPRLPAAAGEANADRVPAIAAGVDVALVAVTTHEPDEPVRRAELLEVVLRKARAVELLYVKAYQAYRRYEYAFGKTHGAYIHLARLAVLDVRGRVVQFRSWRTPVDAAPRPAPRVVRQVRAIHLEAVRRIRAAGGDSDYAVPREG